jgi:tetratricopeptide (TPR) repeat protein
MTDQNRLDSALKGPNPQFRPQSLAKFLAFSLTFGSLSAALSEITLGRTLGRPAQQSTQAPSGSGSKADDEKEARLLEPGKAIKRELSGAGSHTYQIKLSAGQFLKVIVEQQGIDVVVQVSGPDGKQILEFDSESRSQGREELSLVAEVAGAFLLTVRPRQNGTSAGSYEIRIEESRAATDTDRALHDARKQIEESLKLRRARKYDEALPLAERALEIRERLLLTEHRDIAAAIDSLAGIYTDRGEYVKAEPLYRRALAIREKALGKDHPDTAESLNNLAELYETQGKYGEAEPLYKRALDIREKALDKDHPETAVSLNNLAVLYLTRGKYVDAEPLFKRSLDINEKTLGKDHPNTGASLNSLAVLYDRQGKYVEAEPLYKRALDINEKALGKDHPNTANSLNTLAMLYESQAKYEEAEPLLKRALDIRERALGKDHPSTAVSLNNLAGLYETQGKYVEAEPLYKRSLDIRERALGKDHPSTAVSLNNMAGLYETQGKYVEAEPLYKRALDIRERMLGKDHPNTATILNNLALLYGKQGKYMDAEPLYKRALDIRERALGKDHPNTSVSLNSLAALYRAQGKYVEAEPLYRRALDIREKALGKDHPETANILNNLAYLYKTQGKYVEAEPLHKRALDIFEKALGKDHPYTAGSLNNLAVLYALQGKYEEAEPLHKRALDIFEKALGKDHPDTAASLNNMAALYAAKGDLVQAVKFQSRANAASERNLARNLVKGSEREKLAYLALFSKETDFTLSLHSQALPHDPQALDLAFTTLLRRKGRGLDMMADTIGALRRRAAPEDQALFDRLAESRSQLAALTLKGLGKGKPEAYRARLKSLEDKAEELESALSARRPEFRAQPVTLAAVQSAIPAGGVLVEFAVYTPQDPRNNKNKLPPRYLAYLLTSQGQPGWVDLGEAAAIDRAITSWRQALRDPRRTDVKRLARAVDEKVMLPVLALEQSGVGAPRRLLIAPDGLLNLVPFAALVDRQGRYLVERYSISYLTSGRDLLKSPVRRPDNQDTVIVADPDYDAMGDVIAARSQDVGLPPALFGAWRIKLPGVVSRSRDVGLPARLPQSAGSNFNLDQIHFPPLKGTAGEARALKAILPRAKVFTRGLATEAALKQLHSPDILHVATHGFFLRDQEIRLVGGRDLSVDTVQSMEPSNQPIENPLLRSGLALAGVNLRLGRADQGDDGVLTALEAAGLDLFGTKLVALSACDTGVGEVRNGEGVFGLRRALSLAGSETQVMSLWPVSDLGTRDLMTEYYKALERGEGRGDGLRRVQLEMIKRKRRRHPFYWASFIQSGEWANLEGKR